ncbi:Transposase [Pontibacter korlensis]|uniref:Uncharacterized protein n=1 Tax=Pontibacter korlensis TaxID=400092 RepID=A0A0E3ZBI4_9BACT|nr:hypothetical protein PKOR_01325 [Pontibacter korlensis]
MEGQVLSDVIHRMRQGFHPVPGKGGKPARAEAALKTVTCVCRLKRKQGVLQSPFDQESLFYKAIP